GVSGAVGPVNRSEALLVIRFVHALCFAEQVDVGNTGIVADLLHMNIGEADPIATLGQARGRLLEIHLADSNRRGLGHGHLPLATLLSAAADVGFEGAYVMELVAQNDAELDEHLTESVTILRGEGR